MIQYPFHVLQSESEGHLFWIAKSEYLRGCVGQGDTQEDAIKELQENEHAWLETANEMGIDYYGKGSAQGLREKGWRKAGEAPAAH